MSDEQYIKEFVSNIKKMVQESVNRIKIADTVETTVSSTNPLSIRIGTLKIEGEHVKIVNNIHLKQGDKVLVIRSRDRQKYYIMGGI